MSLAKRRGPGRRAPKTDSEFALIDALTRRLGPLALGLGDDASVLQVPRGDQMVVSTDAAIESVHFRRSWLSLSEIGYRAVTAALSDLAAMAASPLGVLVALQLDPTSARKLTQLVEGIADAVRAAGTAVVGGNIARAATLGITTTVVGSVREPLRRSGARPGDLIYLTGTLGGPIAAVKALAKRRKPAPTLRQRFAHPDARIREARWLASRGAIAAIDISDGLAQDAAHLARASGVTMEIDVNRVPIMRGAATDDVLAGGEEYELLVMARAPLPEHEFAETFGIPLTAIGRATEGTGVTLTRAGKRVASPAGYDHFSR